MRSFFVRSGSRSLGIFLVAIAVSSSASPSPGLPSATSLQLRELVGFWETHARYCIDAHVANEYKKKVESVAPFPGKEVVDDPATCDDQDMTLFNGLLCSVGDPRGCDGVRRAQDANTGQWWRSPALIGWDRTRGGAAASMSEEQTWGVFLYLLQTGDKRAFEKWVEWIANESRPCWIGQGSSCLRGPPQWCKDNVEFAACNFLPFECVVFEALAHRFEGAAKVAAVSHLLGCDLVMGVTYTVATGIFGAFLVASNMVDAQGFTKNYPVQAQVLVQALATKTDYAIHKIGVQIYLLQKLGLDNATLRKAVVQIADGSANPFLLYLRDGATQGIADLTVQKCPKRLEVQPKYRRQWAWEREDAKKAWLESSYWDCIFAAKLLVGHVPTEARALPEMLLAQSKAIATPFRELCSAFKATTTATAQSPETEERYDYQVVFGSVTEPLDGYWYSGKTFVTPCSGKYLVRLSVTSGASTGSDPKTVALVSTYRYGEPFINLTVQPLRQNSGEVIRHLERYEAIAVVIPSSAAAVKIANAKFAIVWCADQTDAKSACN
jgi:hypothetical protein